jgi:hypothetical protein
MLQLFAISCGSVERGVCVLVVLTELAALVAIASLVAA